MQDQLYYVVKNHEDQYSIWAKEKTIPLGWHAIGEPTSKEECLQRIEGLWTDMTPKSLREHYNSSATTVD